MPAARRAPLVALLALLQRRFPCLDDPARLVEEGTVLVNGVPAQSPRTRVRADAAIQIRHTRPLRGTIKLAHALAVFGIDAAGAVALDLGAAAGGFTQALLDAGAARVYAVDAGAGQLRGWLRRPPGDQPRTHQPGPAQSAPHHRAGQPDHHGGVLPGHRRRHRPDRPADASPSSTAHRTGQANIRTPRRIRERLRNDPLVRAGQLVVTGNTL